MTDRELLQFAAKAAGYSESKESAFRPDSFVVKTHANEWTYWNPITDDGDALRLAVKLRLHVSVFSDAIGIGTPGSGYVETEWVDDPYAATRRAIVRAAAEIRKGMK